MSTFNTRQQYNQITQLFSKVFDIKLSKVRHKISTEEGFKNSNAYVTTLPEEIVSAEVVEQSNPKINPESLSSDFLNEIITFEIYKSDKNGELVLSEITAPRAIKFIFDGYLFTSEEWLTKTVYHYDLNEFEETIITTKYDDFETAISKYYFDAQNIDARYSFSLALLQQIVNDSFIIKDEKMLIKNPKMTMELIDGGSIQQYNFICKNVEVVNNLNLEALESLGIRYITILNLLSNQDIYDFNSDAHYISYFISNMSSFEQKYNNVSACKALPTLETPPLKALSPNLDNYCIEHSVVSQLLEGFFPIAGDTLMDSPFKSLHNSLGKNLNNESYVPSIQESAYIKHASFAVQYLCGLISQSKGNEYAVLDFTTSLSYIKYLNLDFPEFQNALLCIPRDGIYTDISLNDNKCFYNSTIASWFICSRINDISQLNSEFTKKSYKNDLNVIFKLLNDEVLNSEMNISKEHFIYNKEILAETKTVKELLTTYLRLIK